MASDGKLGTPSFRALRYPIRPRTRMSPGFPFDHPCCRSDDRLDGDAIPLCAAGLQGEALGQDLPPRNPRTIRCWPARSSHVRTAETGWMALRHDLVGARNPSPGSPRQRSVLASSPRPNRRDQDHGGLSPTVPGLLGSVAIGQPCGGVRSVQSCPFAVSLLHVGRQGKNRAFGRPRLRPILGRKGSPGTDSRHGRDAKLYTAVSRPP